MPCSGHRKCLNCHQFFKPDPRSKGRQRFCSEAPCRTASKLHSQQKWLSKPENKNYFSGPQHVDRVQRWRQQHPGYSRRSDKPSGSAPELQDTLITQASDSIEEKNVSTHDPLQDLLSAQPLVLIGLIAHLTGGALQEDIADTVQHLQQFGEDLLHSHRPRGRTYDKSHPT